MKKNIDLTTWKRKAHFVFFEHHSEPFFGITTNVDCTNAYLKAKEMNVSFFLYYMHKSLMAVNTIKEFRCRIEENLPVEYDAIHGSTTSLNADGLFAFTFLPYHEDFERFCESAKLSIDKTKTIHGIGDTEENSRNDVIHYSTIPWVSFTSVTHERNFSRPDSVPKITFGKYFRQEDKLLLPVSVNGHHGLMDGMHAGEYFELFQKLLS